MLHKYKASRGRSPETWRASFSAPPSTPPHLPIPILGPRGPVLASLDFQPKYWLFPALKARAPVCLRLCRHPAAPPFDPRPFPSLPSTLQRRSSPSREADPGPGRGRQVLCPGGSDCEASGIQTLAGAGWGSARAHAGLGAAVGSGLAAF